MGSTDYIKNDMDDPGYLGKFCVGGLDHFGYIFFVYPMFQPIIDIMTQKISAYDPWGLPTTSKMSWMTLGTLVSFVWVGLITIGLFSWFTLYFRQ